MLLLPNKAFSYSSHKQAAWSLTDKGNSTLTPHLYSWFPDTSPQAAAIEEIYSEDRKALQVMPTDL